MLRHFFTDLPRRVRHLAALLPLLAANCSAVGTLNALTPQDGYRVIGDVAYGAGARRGLDIYVPQGIRHAPVVVFFYGGNWDSGTKGDYRFVGEAFAARGFIVVIPDYRLYPDIRYPAFLADNAAAVGWVHDHIAQYGGDPGRLFLMGHSAGGYNAAMLALDRHLLGAVGLDPDRDISGVVGLAGPYDFLPITDPELQANFGPREGWPATQPINYVHRGAPPFLLIAGTADKTVDPGNVTRLARRLKAYDVPVRTRLYRGIGHRELVGSLAALLRFLAPALRDSVAFMREAPTTTG